MRFRPRWRVGGVAAAAFAATLLVIPGAAASAASTGHGQTAVSTRTLVATSVVQVDGRCMGVYAVQPGEAVKTFGCRPATRRWGQYDLGHGRLQICLNNGVWCLGHEASEAVLLKSTRQDTVLSLVRATGGGYAVYRFVHDCANACVLTARGGLKQVKLAKYRGSLAHQQFKFPAVPSATKTPRLTAVTSNVARRHLILVA